MNDDILTVDQAADFLQLTPPTIRQMAARGLLPGRRFGRMWRFSRRQLLEFIETGNPPPTPPISATERQPYTTGVDSESAILGFSQLPSRPIRRNRR
jgi:excisionase family DNA binding protein